MLDRVDDLGAFDTLGTFGNFGAFDAARAVRSLPGAEPFPGLPGAWWYSPVPVLTFVVAVSPDGTRVHQMNTRGAFDPDLTRAVLVFAREHGAGQGPDPRPVEVVPGFGHPGRSFDAVAAVPAAVHGLHAGRTDGLAEAVTRVFPAHRCEFSGRETVEEATVRVKELIRPEDTGRGPAPYLRMRYDNTRTRGGSTGRERGFARHEALLREVPLLEGAPGSFVEFENRAGEVRRVEWHANGRGDGHGSGNGSWTVNGVPQDHAPSEDLLLAALDWPGTGP
ncbi:hypothetical protein [Streptomyces sp. NPDC097619]|uniref:hypothetical protein n=1 Tax=Streptomyces sp. NPDC097619 TaxID=3157228 RepID=UPI00332A35B6